MNLLEETISELEANGLTPKDVRWVGTEESWGSWGEFAELANKEYDNDFGLPEVQLTLAVVGEDWWLERHEYDGSEHWQLKTFPDQPKTKGIKAEDIFYGK